MTMLSTVGHWHGQALGVADPKVAGKSVEEVDDKEGRDDDDERCPRAGDDSGGVGEQDRAQGREVVDGDADDAAGDLDDPLLIGQLAGAGMAHMAASRTVAMTSAMKMSSQQITVSSPVVGDLHFRR